jgi:formylglycine-generating enzyme required for sulfatase activity
MRMQKRTAYLSLSLTILLLLGLAVLQPIAAQDALIPDMETVQAGAEQLFTATAQASAYSTVALTVEAEFRRMQTATAEASSPTDATSTPSETATPEDVATLTDVAQMLTRTVAIVETATALFAEVPQWVEEVGSELVRVDGGTFQMGTTAEEVAVAVDQCVNDEGGNCQIAFGADSLPQHSVTISAFQIEQTEVTYRQYLIFLAALGAGSHRSGCDGQPCVITRSENENSNITYSGTNYQVSGVIENFPVANVTWYGANAYCRMLGRRLPTEAEWERAARGYDNFIYPWGNEWNPAFAKTSLSPDETIGALAVGSLPIGASVYGTFDMAGNVAEWVSDWYDPTYYSQRSATGLDPIGPADGTEKVLRGGSWDAKPFFARSVHRQSGNPFDGYSWAGFRCATDIDGTAPTPTPRFTNTPVSPTPALSPTANATGPAAIEATPTATPT